MNKIWNARGKIASPNVLNSPEPGFISWLICQINCFVLWDRHIDYVNLLEMQAVGVAAQSTGLVKPSATLVPQGKTVCVLFILTSESVPLLCVLGVGRYQCFKSAWMFEVFHRGFSFPVNYKTLKTALQVYDKEVQWTLGAILYRTRFLPLRYGCFSIRKMLFSFAIVMAAVGCEFLGTLVSTDRGQNCRLLSLTLLHPHPYSFPCSSPSLHVQHRV